MILLTLRSLPKWAAVILMAVIGILVLPTLAHAASTTDLIQMFKYTYGSDRLAYLAAQEIVLWRILKKKMTPVGGRGQWILPIQTQNAGVWVGHSEGGPKTTRRSQPSTTEATFKLQEFHGVWDVSWKILQDARKSEYAFERALDFMDESFRRRTFRLLNADLNGTGRGELASISASQDGGVVATVTSLPFVDQGMIVDMVSAADDNTTLGIAGRSVASISVQNRTLTLNAGANILGSAAKDYFTVADSVSIAAGSLHTHGIRAWIDTSNPATILGGAGGNTGGGLALLGGLDRTNAVVASFWTGNVLSNSGTLRPWSEDLMLQGQDLVRERGGRVVTDYMSDLAILRRYHESLRADTFFALNSIKALGDKIGLGRDEEAMEGGEDSEGETPYEFSSIPWRAEMFFAPNTIIGFNREHFMIGHGDNEMPRPLSEIFDDMIPYFTGTANTTFEVVSYWQGDLLCDNPPAGVKWTDIAES